MLNEVGVIQRVAVHLLEVIFTEKLSNQQRLVLWCRDDPLQGLEHQGGWGLQAHFYLQN
ncbi:hypothetical protein D3C81_1823930 [compost metagenome]